jgi:hypothetical protein
MVDQQRKYHLIDTLPQILSLGEQGWNNTRSQKARISTQIGGWDLACHSSGKIISMAKSTPMPLPKCGRHLETLDSWGSWVNGYTLPNTINTIPTYGFTYTKPPYSISPLVCRPRRLSRQHTRWETTDLGSVTPNQRQSPAMLRHSNTWICCSNSANSSWLHWLARPPVNCLGYWSLQHVAQTDVTNM